MRQGGVGKRKRGCGHDDGRGVSVRHRGSCWDLCAAEVADELCSCIAHAEI